MCVVPVQSYADCGECDHTVALTVSNFNGDTENVQPGDVICIDAGTRGHLRFINIHGSAENPVIIRNCGGVAHINITTSGSSEGLALHRSQYVRITGQGSDPEERGIRVSGGVTWGISITDLSTDVEVDHCEIHDISFSGIHAKTDPRCDGSSNRGNFVMENIRIHHNRIYRTEGEGIYAGFSFYQGYSQTSGCQGTTLYPHDMVNVEIYENDIHDTGWEAIQLGCGVSGARIYNNRVRRYGTKGVQFQNRGIQLGGGTGGECFGNFIADGPASGLIAQGLADNRIYNNILVRTAGMFLDEGAGGHLPDGFQIYNNTIVAPSSYGIDIRAEQVDMNRMYNNLIVQGIPLAEINAPLNVTLDRQNNLIIDTISAAGFINAANDDYRLGAGSPARNAGINNSAYMPALDHGGRDRPVAGAWSAGAYEFNAADFEFPFEAIESLVGDEQGWAESSWFGNVRVAQYPFVTQEYLGDLWIQNESESAIWLWNWNLPGWIFTRHLAWPYVWIPRTQN